jgi:hypothetical protein
MKRISLLLLAGVLMSASVIMNIFEQLEYAQDDAKKEIVGSFGSGYLNLNTSVVKKARALPEAMRVEGTRQLIRFAREYSQTDDFKSEYASWRRERLGGTSVRKKKFSLSNPMKMLEKAVDKQLNKSDDEKKIPADANKMIKQRLESFLELSETVDFSATVSGGRFTNPEYEAKSQEWKMCYRAGKAVITAAREEAQAWLKELE